jgi:hypothetical protein
MTSTEISPSSSHLEDRLLKLSSSALAENLLAHTADENAEPDAELVDQWMHEIGIEMRRRRHDIIGQKHSGGDEEDHTSTTFALEDSVSEEELLKLVQDEGFRSWKQQGSSSLPPLAQASSNKKSTSMSLFLSQLNGGGALQSFVSWERIQEESQGDDVIKLQLLEKVQHLQDLLPDWEGHVRPFFLQGLRQSSSRQHFADLHRQWFDKSRSSSQYRTLQIDLCQNLVTVADEESKALLSSGDGSADTSQLQNLVDLALDMFEDWMLRGLYVRDSRVWSIGRTLWGWLLVEGDNSTCLSSLSPAAQCMIQVDGQATWFSSWLAHLSPDQCLDLCADAAKTLPKVLTYCQQQDPTNDHAVCCFWLTVLHNILLSTRVSRFPWELVIEGHTDDSKLFVLDLFLGCFLQVDNDQSNMIMYADAIETILAGCRGDDKLFTIMMAKVTALQKNNKNERKHQLLQKIRTRFNPAS